MTNNEVETLLNNEEENQVLLTKEEPVVQQQEESADFLDENANMYSDSYRKSVFDGGTAIYPYGKDNTAIYLNDPKIDEEFKGLVGGNAYVIKLNEAQKTVIRQAPKAAVNK